MLTNANGNYFGWLRIPAAVQRYLAISRSGYNSSQLQQLAAQDDQGDRLFWLLEQAVWGRELAVWDQANIGSCVSHGAGKAAEDTLTIQVGELAAPEGVPPAEIAREPIYGGSRCQIGGQWGSRSDGSTGAWAAEWLQRYGLLCYIQYPGEDLSNGYQVERCKQWGARGCPRTLEPTAKLHPVQDTVQINSVEDCWTALGNYNPVAICGNISRTMNRQPGGFCPKTGNNWPHCQCLRGRVTVRGGQRAVIYQNSWGDYLGSGNNTVTPESGEPFQLPPGCYLSTLEEIASDLREGDTFAYSHAIGFPKVSVDWNRLPLRRPAVAVPAAPQKK